MLSKLEHRHCYHKNATKLLLHSIFFTSICISFATFNLEVNLLIRIVDNKFVSILKLNIINLFFGIHVGMVWQVIDVCNDLCLNDICLVCLVDSFYFFTIAITFLPVIFHKFDIWLYLNISEPSFVFLWNFFFVFQIFLFGIPNFFFRIPNFSLLYSKFSYSFSEYKIEKNWNTKKLRNRSSCQILVIFT